MGRDERADSTRVGGEHENSGSHVRGKEQRVEYVARGVGSRDGHFADRGERDLEHGRPGETAVRARAGYERDDEANDRRREQKRDHHSTSSEFVVEMAQEVAGEFGERAEQVHQVGIEIVIDACDALFLKRLTIIKQNKKINFSGLVRAKAHNSPYIWTLFGNLFRRLFDLDTIWTKYGHQFNLAYFGSFLVNWHMVIKLVKHIKDGYVRIFFLISKQE